ncbi:hypothetical protein EIP91_001851 [Steccherinum ochraceum]|uniref:AB hydrolase-1 domain-containing protein n=1 Tax=Steccherinum ochraceum TaxID=92696 RepID=A0A4R0RH23_9APHY|nr:hypothetical protein EIP91_001851 [Steccherinum ochraceum]
MQLIIDEFFLIGRPEHGSLRHAYKRYRWDRSSTAHIPSPKNGIALVFLHCINSRVLHKETWEPTIEHIFELQATSSNLVNVEEAWSMDIPNHGRAAKLNDEALQMRPEGIDAYVPADGLQLLLLSGLMIGDKVVGVGHSAGAAITILETSGYPLTRLPFDSIILVEPSMMTREVLHKVMTGPDGGHPLRLIMTAAKRRLDTWKSRDEAHQWFVKRYPWKRWDPRVLELFVRYGLHDLPTGTYPTRYEGVTLAYWLSFVLPYLFIASLAVGKKWCMWDDEIRAGILDVEAGRRMTSVTTVDNAGHLIPQENPEGMANAIWMLLGASVTKNAYRL